MKKNKFKLPQEWLKQSSYDFETAEAMFKTGRYIYTVFMCHLAVEKSLKGLYAKMFKKNPPKIHDLNYLCEKTNLKISDELQDFIDKLNSLSVPTRYPDELENLVKDYKKNLTKLILDQTRELLVCLKSML